MKKHFTRVINIYLCLLVIISCTKQEIPIQKELYNAVYNRDVRKLELLIKKGVNPDYCIGECGWVDSNPLNIVSDTLYDTYYRRQWNESIPEPTPDVMILKILIEAGADINMRPYIWNRVYQYNNEFFNRTKDSVIDLNNPKPKDYEEQLNVFIQDANRLLKVFLEAGADPDMKGHPYPFSSEAINVRITDAEAKKYFINGTRAINIAIEKGSKWESQVDLLLQYTKLDEESLRAAERSNDTLMIDKITKLWSEQSNLFPASIADPAVPKESKR